MAEKFSSQRPSRNVQEGRQADADSIRLNHRSKMDLATISLKMMPAEQLVPLAQA
jgi:hypothetical protein